jgi:SHS2 domain-containing protein
LSHNPERTLNVAGYHPPGGGVWIKPVRGTGLAATTMYEVFEHTADLGLRVQADSFEGLLRDAARALFSVIVANLDQVRLVQQKVWQLEGDSHEYLFFDWLNELLFTFDTERLLLADFAVDVQGLTLRATARGERLDPRRHQLEHEIKAITYHGLRVEQQGEGWFAEVIVDI